MARSPPRSNALILEVCVADNVLLVESITTLTTILFAGNEALSHSPLCSLAKMYKELRTEALVLPKHAYAHDHVCSQVQPQILW